VQLCGNQLATRVAVAEVLAPDPPRSRQRPHTPFHRPRMVTSVNSLQKEAKEYEFSVEHPLQHEAEAAAVEAAAPYLKKRDELVLEVHKLQQQADSDQTTARMLRGAAKGTANGAVARQAGGDVVGARDAMMTAHHQMYQAIYYSDKARKEITKAQGVELMIPAYADAVQTIEARIRSRVAPSLYPPEPVSAAGFTAPLPPV